MTFQIVPLPAAPFIPLFSLSDQELAARRARRVMVDAHPGYPCRISLADAEVGETVILLNHEHLPADTPYRSSHAIYVREGASPYTPPPGTVPDVIARRLISVRMFDASGNMLAADVKEGTQLAPVLEAALADPAVSFIHLHNARQGCFAAKVVRAA